MQGMRRREENGLHLAVGDRICKFRRQLEALGGREIANQIRLLAHAADDMQALALALHRFDDRLAPASEADNGGVDHGWRRRAGGEKYVIVNLHTRLRDRQSGKGIERWTKKIFTTEA
jgi:hypothetical protein